MDKVDWDYLSGNKNAISILENNLDKVKWLYLSLNINAISILEKNLDKVDWHYLSRNRNAIFISEKNLDKLNKEQSLSPNITKLDTMFWSYLSRNPMAIQLLEQNQDKIHWRALFENPSIFCCDYDYYKKRMDIHREELMKKVFHPRRLAYYLEIDYDMFD